MFDRALREGVHEMRRISYAVALVALFLLLLNTGCYTVLRHPTGSNVVQEDTYYRSCADCHADAAYYHPYSQPYYSSHYGWGSYYGSPWWYDDYYWYDPGYDYDDDYIGPKVETGGRHLWSTGGWGFGTSRSGSRNPAPSVTSPGQKNDKNAKKKEAEKKDEKKDEKKKDEKKDDERNLWKKPTRSRG